LIVVDNVAAGKWRELHNEDLHNLYSSPDIIRQIKKNEMGDMWHSWGRRNVFRFWWESQKERDHLEDQGVDARMGSEWILVLLAGGV
jgi:hypothetical protein